MRFAVDIRYTRLPWKYRRRVGFRNSKIRLENSGFVNYERLWMLGLDVTIEWGGKLNHSKPQWAYRRTPKPSTAVTQRSHRHRALKDEADQTRFFDPDN